MSDPTLARVLVSIFRAVNPPNYEGLIDAIDANLTKSYASGFSAGAREMREEAAKACERSCCECCECAEDVRALKTPETISDRGLAKREGGK